jgi:hypothetical protein
MFTMFATSAVQAGTMATFVVAGASGLAVALAAVFTIILGSIQFADQAQLPGKLAALVVGARNAHVDPAELLSSDSGKQTLFSLFVSATGPSPRADERCDNSLIPVNLWGGPQDQATVRDPETGRVVTVKTTPCLNPTPIPAVSPSDPRFSVSSDGVPPAIRQSLSMQLAGVPGASTQVRVSGHWFVQEITTGGTTSTTQSLGLAYTDWEGHSRYVTLARQSDGTLRFSGLTEKGVTAGADPATCEGDGACFTSDRLQYLGSDGRKYVASLKG